MLLVHGWAVSAYLWRHNIRPLAAAGYRVIAPDLPGHGLSDAPSAAGSYTVEAFARYVLETLDACGVERAAVAGQSMGGKVVVRAALDAPARVSQLLLYGAVGFGLIPPWQALSPLIPTLPGEWIAKLIPREFATRRNCPYAIERLREQSRILEPQEKFDPYRDTKIERDEVVAEAVRLPDLRDLARLPARVTDLLRRSESKPDLYVRVLAESVALAGRLRIEISGPLLDRIDLHIEGKLFLG